MPEHLFGCSGKVMSTIERATLLSHMASAHMDSNSYLTMRLPSASPFFITNFFFCCSSNAYCLDPLAEKVETSRLKQGRGEFISLLC